MNERFGWLLLHFLYNLLFSSFNGLCLLLRSIDLKLRLFFLRRTLSSFFAFFLTLSFISFFLGGGFFQNFHIIVFGLFIFRLILCGLGLVCLSWAFFGVFIDLDLDLSLDLDGLGCHMIDYKWFFW